MVKHIGIVGVTAEGASLCHKTICSEASKIMGINYHPEISLHNQSFHKFIEPFNRKDWKSIAQIINNSIKKLASSGADLGVGWGGSGSSWCVDTCTFGPGVSAWDAVYGNDKSNT